MQEGGGRHLLQWGVWSRSVTPEKSRNFICKFRLSGILSARKLTPERCKIPHISIRGCITCTHHRVTLKNKITGIPARIHGTRDRGARKGDVPAKTGWVATVHRGTARHCMCRSRHAINVDRCPLSSVCDGRSKLTTLGCCVLKKAEKFPKFRV